MPEVLQYNDYDPFGKITPNRHGGENYRYGFNTQEKTDEIAGEGNHTTAMYWEYDTRIGRRWNLDPVFNPSESGYGVLNNDPINKVDEDGDFALPIIGAIVGAVKEVVAQTIANGIKNKMNGESFFHNWGNQLDLADIAVSSGEGAVAFSTMGLSFLATNSLSSSLKGAIDFKGEDDWKLKSVFGSGEYNKSLSEAFKDTAQSFVGNYIGKGMGWGGFDNIAKSVTKSSISQAWNATITGSIQGYLEGIVNFGTDEVGDGIQNKINKLYTNKNTHKKKKHHRYRIITGPLINISTEKFDVEPNFN